MLLHTAPDQPSSRADETFAELDENGIVLLPTLLQPEQLSSMQQAFAARLKRLRWNNFDGYEKTELYRHMVQDVLTLEQGFVDLALAPIVKEVLNRYLGDGYELTEAKGWKSLPTRRDFHGWHGDAWYEQDGDIHREVKLALYLTDVRSGAFNYIRGSHRRQHPRMIPTRELTDIRDSQVTQMLGPAGTAFLFDTTGIHRQGVPMLEPRQAIFYNYHHPDVKLQRENIDHYRYHPLILNAAFLGGLSRADEQILGFGNKTNFVSAFEHPARHSLLQKSFRLLHQTNIRILDLNERVKARLSRKV